MSRIIDNFDFESPAMKYWSVPKGKSVKDELRNFIYSGHCVCSRKVDGNWLMIGKDEDGVLFTRARNLGVDGTYANKIGHIPHIAELLGNLPNGTVLLGEIYLPSKEQSRAVTTILGCLEEKAIARQQKGEKLHYYVFDCLAYGGKATYSLPIMERVSVAKKVVDSLHSEYVELATYITDANKIEEYIAVCLEKGYEGVVLQRDDIPYEWGKRTAHHSLKVKKEVAETIDCYVTGNYKNATLEYTGKELPFWTYWLNQKTGEKINKNMYNDYLEGNGVLIPITKGAYYGWAGAIEFAVRRGDQDVNVCWISNISDEIKQEIVEQPQKWVHKVAKITAMMIEKDTKKLRHAKIAEWRNDGDKDWLSCDGGEIFG